MDFETRLKFIIESDTDMMSVLKIVESLNLNDCWIGAGFVRNKVWNQLHGFKSIITTDIDVIYHDSKITTKDKEVELEKILKGINSSYKWSVKNQARMHLRNNHYKYINSEDAISYWPETATAVALRIVKDKVEIISPYGLSDLFNLRLVKSSKSDYKAFSQRLDVKKWKNKWPKLILNEYNG
jgi:uncharacterized protein